MGDDLPDIVLLNKAGVSACPADAVTEVLQLARYISPFNGGKGCVRDVIEKPCDSGSWPVFLDYTQTNATLPMEVSSLTNNCI